MVKHKSEFRENSFYFCCSGCKQKFDSSRKIRSPIGTIAGCPAFDSLVPSDRFRNLSGETFCRRMVYYWFQNPRKPPDSETFTAAKPQFGLSSCRRFLVRAISARILAFATSHAHFISKAFLGGVPPVRNCSRLLLHYAKRWIYIRKTKADNCSRRGCNINIANR